MKFEWVKNKKTQACIKISNMAKVHEKFAAEELSKYFEKMGQVKLPISTISEADDSSPSIYILDASRPSNLRFLKGTELDQLKDDGFIIKSVGNRLLITSKEPSGLVYAVYQYLNRVYGVSFLDYAPHGENVPKLSNLSHDRLDILINPELKYRSLQDTYDLRRIDWMIKNGFNYTRLHKPSEWWDHHSGPLIQELKKRGIKVAYAHHIFQHILPTESYFDTHPDYFPLINGKRTKRTQFSWAVDSEEALNEAIYNLVDLFERHPEIDMLDFWPADGECEITPEEYRNLTGKELDTDGEWTKHVSGSSIEARLGNPNKERVYAIMLQKVADVFKEKLPNVTISSLHYVDLIQPCPDVRIPENVIPFITLYWRCIKHPITSGSCKYNKQYLQVIHEWAEMYPGRDLYFYEYYLGMDRHSSLPYPLLTSLFEEWDELKKIGITGAMAQSCDTQSVPYNINFLAFTDIAWKHSSSRDEYIDKYCKDFFMDASENMKELYHSWEESCQYTDHTQPGFDRFHNILPPTVLADNHKLIIESLSTSKDPKVIFRLSRLLQLVVYAQKVSEFGPKYQELMQSELSGQDNPDLKRELLPQLKDILELIQALKDNDQDIFQHYKETTLLRIPFVKRKVTPYERDYARLMKEQVNEDDEDPDIILAKMRSKNKTP